MTKPAASQVERALVDAEVKACLAARRSILARLLDQLVAIPVEQTIEQVADDLVERGRPDRDDG